jgi:adenylate cyclase
MARAYGIKTILAIEDETEVLTFVSRVLELEGYRVLKAGDGDTGLGLAREYNIALVLLDLRLPGRDGWSVLWEMKGDPKLSAVPVIVLTASAGMPQRDRAIEIGAVNYLVKPLSATSLREAVARVLKPSR